MKLVKFLGRDGRERAGVLQQAEIHPLRLENGQIQSLAELMEMADLLPMLDFLRDRTDPQPLDSVTLLPPIDQQEVWAAGVTYKRSKAARMEESTVAASCYDRVYESPRPELFLKATPHRVVGHDAAIRIRQDSHWNVPEPELTLVLNSRLDLVGRERGLVAHAAPPPRRISRTSSSSASVACTGADVRHRRKAKNSPTPPPTRIRIGRPHTTRPMPSRSGSSRIDSP